MMNNANFSSALFCFPLIVWTVLYLVCQISRTESSISPNLINLNQPISYGPNWHCVISVKKGARRSTTYPVPLRYPVDENICITYADINRAVYTAKKKLGGFIPEQAYELSSDFPKPIHVAVPAEIMEEATRLLAEWFDLSIHTVLYLLPRVDTTRTAARDICPTFLMPVKCELSKYRTLTGMCNNLNYPSWGASRTAMIRYLPPAFADGKFYINTFFTVNSFSRTLMSVGCAFEYSPIKTHPSQFRNKL